MTFLVNLVAVVTLATMAISRSTPAPPRPFDDSYASYALNLPTGNPYAVPLNLQLPRAEPPQVPFYTAPVYETSEQATVLLPPQIPIPSQDLRAPTETQWNPNDDPKLYFEIPALLTRQELPTNLYPKKYNKEIHTKGKPYAGRPKEEIVVVPIEEQQYRIKEKAIGKTYDSLAKQENRKQLQALKEEQEKSQQTL